jgi:YjbE family integral membrane protein
MSFLLELNWLAVSQIILIDILLGGDNAIVIALACRNLPPKLRTKGILWGTAGAILLRIGLIAFAVTLLQVPYLKLVGGLLLLWIGIKLLADNDDGHNEIPSSDRLLAAIKTIIIADLVMSMDNVIAVASTAEQAAGGSQLALVAFGIVISIPIIVWGSTMVLSIMVRFPLVITLGAALLGYLAGGMIFSDQGMAPWVLSRLPAHEITLPGASIHVSIPGVIGAIAVVLAGKWLAKRE